jgi:CheY-specific phosphatase CheX
MKRSISQHHILLLRAGKELTENAQAAIEKFRNMHGIKINLVNSNINMAAEQIEKGQISIIFCETPMETSESNFFTSCMDRTKQAPFVICCRDNFDKIEKHVPKDRIFCQKGEFTKNFVFNCIRNLLTPPNHKIDTRYIKSILLSVINVIQQNTGLNLQPQPITELKQQEQPEDLLTAMTFYGDGFLGSITIKTSQTLLQRFAEKIFFNDAQIDIETQIDLLGEIANQILGVARNELKEFGYELRNSLQLVCTGDQLLYNMASNGRYYEIPFKLDSESFSITFCYNTYRTSVFELEVAENNRHSKCLDIRLVDQIDRSIKSVCQNNLQTEIKRDSLHSHKTHPVETACYQIFHAAGWEGEISIALEAPKRTCQFIREKMFGPQDENHFDASEINDLMKELLNQIGGDFLTQCKLDGYSFQRIYQGSFTHSEVLSHVLKVPGHVVRFQYNIDNLPLILTFCSRSEFASSYFDTWPYLKAQPAFDQTCEPGA